MYNVCKERERLGSKIFVLANKEFENKPMKLKISNISIYGLHVKSPDTLFCEIDINQLEGIKK